MVRIDQGGTDVRSGRAGDAVRIVKRPRRRICASLVDPQGRVFKGLGRRPAPLAMHPASLRDPVLTQVLENAVRTVSIAQIGSLPLRFAMFAA